MEAKPPRMAAMDSAEMRGLYVAYELFTIGRYGYQGAMDSSTLC